MVNHKLSEWFGLSYSSFCVMPRVLMEDMPDEWQEKMAELLNQYDDAFDQSKVGIDGCRVQATMDNKLVKMPSELLNYRRPCQLFLDKVRSED
ncbi:hypothetical protein NVP1181O_19 [Vibrio phage 1.181.O._10N.286.46.C9]|nr:hypothetical protein NVP1181O_19 [Vibrio phage 1.181.O._10N.286.46.C9]